MSPNTTSADVALLNRKLRPCMSLSDTRMYGRRFSPLTTTLNSFSNWRVAGSTTVSCGNGVRNNA